MSEVQKIEHAVQQLSPEAFAEFRSWFAQYDAEIWDRQIERDVDAGRLDKLANEALNDLRKGRCTEL